MPGAEVLRRRLDADHLPQVVVDVFTADVAPTPAGAVGQQFGLVVLAPEQPAHDGVQVVVHQLLDPLLATLGRVVEDDGARPDRDVVAADSRQSVRAVLVRVGLPADPEEAEVEHPESRCEHAFAWVAGQRQMLLDHAAGVGKAPGKLQDAVVLGPVPLLPPRVVVAVLPASGRVGPDGLDVAVRQRADPDVGPRRR